MYDKKSLVLGFALFIVGVLCLIQVNKEPAIDPDAKIALKFIQDSTTFKNNNVPNSIKLIKVTQANPLIYPSFKIVEVEYDSYSYDYVKTDFALTYTRNLRHHIAVLHVSDGKVTKCIIDGEWDEIAQTPVAFYPTEEEAKQVAIDFISSCPTFRFDGVPDSIKVLSITQAINFFSSSDVKVVELEFDCFYAGYGFGGRGGFQPLAHHNSRLILNDGKVTRAIIDGVWDELNQKILQDNNPQHIVSISTEEARDIALEYVFRTWGFGLPFPKTWVYNDVTPQGVVGVSISRFTGEEYNVTIKYPIVLSPVYSVKIEQLAKNGLGYVWVGTVDSTGRVIVTSDFIKIVTG